MSSRYKPYHDALAAAPTFEDVPHSPDPEVDQWRVVEWRDDPAGYVYLCRWWQVDADGQRIVASQWFESLGGRFWPRPGLASASQPRTTPPPVGSSLIDEFNQRFGVSDLLWEHYGLRAVPGRNVKCPWHDDKRPSMSVLADDSRVICHASECWGNGERIGQGRDAWDVAGKAMGVAS